MKPIMICALLAVVCNISAAVGLSVTREEDIDVVRLPFGSGTPAADSTVGTEVALHVRDGLYHVPNYLPGSPTAATIWPREVPTECATDEETRKPTCSGYRVYPQTGRGEYIFVRPVAKAPPAPPVVAPAPADPLPVARKKPLG
jgi:hypothetical protein